MKNNKRTSTAALIAILVALNFVVGIVYLLPEGVQDALAAFIAVISVIIVGVCLFIWARAVASKKNGGEFVPRRGGKGVSKRKHDIGAGNRPLPTTAQRSYSPAVYDDNLREDSARLDRERRLRQLDDFYKNGIIEKEEYLRLRKRYENS